MAVIIREATTDDLDDLAMLLVDFNAVHTSGLPHIYQPVVVDAETTDYLRRVLASAQTHQFVADVAGQVVGLLILQREQMPRTPVHVPRQWVIAWAREHGIETIELMVAEFNTAAMAWYEKRDYTPVERRMAYALSDRAPDTSRD